MTDQNGRSAPASSANNAQRPPEPYITASDNQKDVSSSRRKISKTNLQVNDPNPRAVAAARDTNESTTEWLPL